jgi:hypothetical protein
LDLVWFKWFLGLTCGFAGDFEDFYFEGLGLLENGGLFPSASLKGGGTGKSKSKNKSNSKYRDSSLRSE